MGRRIVGEVGVLGVVGRVLGVVGGIIGGNGRGWVGVSKK